MKATYAEFLVAAPDIDTFVSFKRGESDVLRTWPGSVRRGLLRTQDDPGQHYWTSLWEDEADMLGFGRSAGFVALRESFAERMEVYPAFERHETDLRLEQPGAAGRSPRPGDLALRLRLTLPGFPADASRLASMIEPQATVAGTVCWQVHQDRQAEGLFLVIAVWDPSAARARAFVAEAAADWGPVDVRLCDVVFWDA